MRLAPSRKTLLGLFARSSNVCAFPDCAQELVSAPPDNFFIGQVCHIRGVAPGSARFDATFSSDALREYSNLILLCYPHHVEVDSSSERFSVTRLVDIKRKHERRSSSPFLVPERTIAQIESAASPWRDIIHIDHRYDINQYSWALIEYDAPAADLLASGWEALRYFGMLHKRIVEEGTEPLHRRNYSTLTVTSRPNWVIDLYAHFGQVAERYAALFSRLSSPDPTIQAGITEILEGYRQFLDAAASFLARP